jgi:very-short-patch-repair endonuclease
LNGFELDIKRRLEAEGLVLVPQFGVGNYRIDFAVKDPKDPDQFVLAIEADGASYHSGHIARERDRLRQSLLEKRGWTFHRIWSTDWFKDPAAEVAKVVQVYKEVLKGNRIPFESLHPFADEHIDVAQGRSMAHPGFGDGRPIKNYPLRVLDIVISYILSDGLLRPPDVIFVEARQILGYSKNGKQIEAALKASLQRVKARQVN